MYAIRSKKSHRWFSGIDTRYGRGSSHYVKMDEQIPALFKTEELAKLELLIHHLHVRMYEIVEIDMVVVQSERA